MRTVALVVGTNCHRAATVRNRHNQRHRAPAPHRGTLSDVLLMSSPRTEQVAVLLILPEDARVAAHFLDDNSRRDITAHCADLLLEYLLRGTHQDSGQASADAVLVADVRLEGCAPADVRLALVDLETHAVGELPPTQLAEMLAGAVAMAVADAVNPGSDLPS